MNRTRIPFWLVLLLTGLLAGCGGTENGDTPHSDSGLETVELTVGTETVTAEIADTTETRSRGLMYRETLPDDHGMLFVYPSPRVVSFWMKNTPLPLDIAYIREDGTIVGVRAMEPESLRSHPSPSAVPYALEMNQGWFSEHDIGIGDRVGNLPPTESAR